MSTKKSLEDRCPSEDNLELLCLDVNLEASQRTKTQLHLQQCARCRRKFEKIEAFYQNLSLESSKPVSHHVLDLAKAKSKHSVKIGLLICEPLDEAQEKVDKAFRTKLVFSANGVPGGKRLLSEFDYEALPPKAIALRVMTDPVQHKVLIYLWSKEHVDFEDWSLSIPGISEKVNFNSAGSSHLALKNFDHLDGQTIYFQIEQTRAKSRSRYEIIRNNVLV